MTVKPEEGKYVITKAGTKYHVEECSYCKGKEQVVITQEQASYLKIKPCACVERQCISMQEKKKYVTIFIDEAIRGALLKDWSLEIPERNGSYGYIICRGLLEDESLMDSSNILYKRINTSVHEVGITMITIEAIVEVMAKLVVMNEYNNVHIYIDNKSVLEKWTQHEGCQKLAGMFESVCVEFIPREKNRQADRLLREENLISIPFREIKEVVKKARKYDEIKKIVM